MTNSTGYVQDPNLRFQCFNSRAFYPTGAEFRANYIMMITFDLMLAPLAFVLNFLVLVVLAKFPTLRTVSNCILISLAFSDMMTGLIIQPMKATVTLLILRNDYNCALYLTALQLGYLAGMTSYLSLTLMAVERYVAIFHPFRYQQLTTSRRVVFKLLLAIWIVSIFIMSLSFLTPQMSLMRLFVIGLIPTSIAWISFVYIKVTFLVKRMNNKVVTINDAKDSNIVEEDQSVTAGYTSRVRATTDMSENCPRGASCPREIERKVEITKTDFACGTKSGKHQAKRYRSYKSRSNSKATKLVAIIMVTICLCYLPSCVLTFLRDYVQMEHPWLRGVHDWGTSFVLLNSTLNPIIYFLKLRDMRKKMKSMLQSWFEQIGLCERIV